VLRLISPFFRNEDIRDRVGIAPKYGHVQRSPCDAPVHSGVLDRVDNVKRDRGRPKPTWDESVKRDSKEWNIPKELAMDRSAWRLAINVLEP
jgi:hypothetical protein